jgi:AraC-like DNA-binding protein
MTYMEGDPAEPITLGDIAAAAGQSARTVSTSLQDYLSTLR